MGGRQSYIYDRFVERRVFMYRCYGLKIDDESRFIHYAQKGGDILEEQSDYVSKGFLNHYVLGNHKGLDASTLERKWFPTLASDVFLSYSHDDMELAKGIAGFLRDKFKLDVFMDDGVWNSADALLKEIDDEEKERVGGSSYNYRSRNLSTSHVHAMLTSAIMKAIDHSEIVIFLSTDKSIEEIPTPKGTIGEYTLSPWIYEELMISSVIRRKSNYTSKAPHFDERMELILESTRDIYHEIPSIEQMLDEADLLKWATKYKESNEEAIAVLYKMEQKNEVGVKKYIK